MDRSPKITIVIPVYNGSDYLGEAINSALAQTYQNTEIVVVNDGSNDNGKTKTIAESYGNRIHYFEKENGGVASALNLGIQRATGEYISWLSHDDVYYPNKLERQVLFLRKNGKNVVLYSDFDVIDENSSITSNITNRHIDPYNFRFNLLVQSPIHGCTALIKKGFFEQFGYFDEKLKTTQDWEMWFRLSEHVDFVHMKEKLIQSRHHAAQGTFTLKDIQLEESDNLLYAILNSFSDEYVYSVTGIPLSLSYAKIALNLATRNFDESSRLAVERSNRHLSKSPVTFRILTHFVMHLMQSWNSEKSNSFRNKILKRGMSLLHM